jgi:hypothetical protein
VEKSELCLVSKSLVRFAPIDPFKSTAEWTEPVFDLSHYPKGRAGLPSPSVTAERTGSANFCKSQINPGYLFGSHKN